MKFNFDEIIDRRGTNSVKWNLPDKDSDVIPMWVADMDFRVAPAIKEALQRRVEHDIFGYVSVPEAYYQATIDWFSRRHHWTIDRNWILYTSGVVPAISAIIKGLTQPGDKVLIQTPVYNCFFSSIRNNGCEIAENPLKRTGDTYQIDFEDFEKKLKDDNVKIFLLCNPHNPAGRVWTREELELINELCLKHQVIVLSDEIHCELTMPGVDYTPFASISKEAQDNCITCISPTKSFNIAGVQIANIVINQPTWQKLIDKAINVNEVCDVNPFGVESLIAAYREGEEWIEELRKYLWGNYQELCNFFKENLPQLKVTKLEGTYLVWVDIRATQSLSDTLTERLLEEGKVWVNSGTMYGENAGEGFVRINIACPRSRMMEGLRRMAKVIQAS